ncbi:hypothetical protein SAMN05421776_12177 [Nocardia farcinica]|uniref:Uncharacterized protein n=2 Tax=Nocardia farcinica TaxID=37329 RepID=A0A0H5P8M7_NOCFR|nr:hypothetical protein CJ469_05788 [Nocardia farcinica]PFX04433.1 hypothetical protein CJ468_05409 [Nocardia farcinica]CRY84185.1 Uncharacterised protein [Nocardia farcinica]SIT34137.1 hypothetical protein SAMN05421776_12177 [Nocardia farcinica]SLG32497.1 Uncharacterised protein [Mycobacteroides abscessus subsp. abscessus]
MLDQPPPDPARILPSLIELGILVMRDPVGAVNFVPDSCGQLWKRIGRITVSCRTAIIDVWPCGGSHVTSEDLATLEARAIDAWMRPPSKTGEWATCPEGEYGPVWESIVTVPVLCPIFPPVTRFDSAA